LKHWTYQAAEDTTRKQLNGTCKGLVELIHPTLPTVGEATAATATSTEEEAVPGNPQSDSPLDSALLSTASHPTKSPTVPATLDPRTTIERRKRTTSPTHFLRSPADPCVPSRYWFACTYRSVPEFLQSVRIKVDIRIPEDTLSVVLEIISFYPRILGFFSIS
jgi:hypothetical protein